MQYNAKSNIDAAFMKVLPQTDGEADRFVIDHKSETLIKYEPTIADCIL